MGLDVLLPMLGLALLDSINPSALVATLYLLAQPRPTLPVLVYVSAVFSTYFVVGCALMLGLNAVLPSLNALLETPFARVLQGVLGVGLIVYSFRADGKKRSVQAARPMNTTALVAVFALGVSVTLTEFVTALPYVAAIGVLTNAKLSLTQWLPVLFLYNIIFVLSPLGLLAAHRLAGAWFGRRFADGGAGLRAGARETLLWIVGAIGVFLVLNSLHGLGLF